MSLPPSQTRAESKSLETMPATKPGTILGLTDTQVAGYSLLGSEGVVALSVLGAYRFATTLTVVSSLHRHASPGSMYAVETKIDPIALAAENANSARCHKHYPTSTRRRKTGAHSTHASTPARPFTR